MLSATAENPPSSNLRFLGSSFELLLEIYRFRALLAFAAERATSKLPAQLSRLERSLAPKKISQFNTDSTDPLARFLQDMGELTQQIVDAEDLGDVGDRQVCSVHQV